MPSFYLVGTTSGNIHGPCGGEQSGVGSGLRSRFKEHHFSAMEEYNELEDMDMVTECCGQCNP